MIADATNSLSDTVTDVALLAGFRYVDKPADRGHGYGHGKIETLLAAFCGVMLVAAAFGILVPACLDIYRALFEDRREPPPGTIALAAAVVSIIVKEALYRYTAAAGKRWRSPALIAKAWDHRSDALSSAGAMLGVGGAIALGPRFSVLDPIAALFVGALILRTAWQVMAESCQELIEASIGKEGERAILDIIATQDGVLGWHAVKSRKIGYYIAIEAHILVDPNLNIVQAHDIATRLERRLRLEFGGKTHINLHVEPMDKARYERHRNSQTEASS